MVANVNKLQHFEACLHFGALKHLTSSPALWILPTGINSQNYNSIPIGDLRRNIFKIGQSKS